jgi:hypothetical protein
MKPQEPTMSLTSSFSHLSPRTLIAAAEHLEHGSRPTWLINRVAARAFKIAGNCEDAAALLYVAADRS